MIKQFTSAPSKIENDLKVIKLIYKEGLSVLGLTEAQVKSLIKKNLPIDKLIESLNIKSKVIPENWEKRLDISGSENIIYFNKKDPRFIYKLNSPELNVMPSSSANRYIISMALHNYLVPNYPLIPLFTVDNRIMYKQLIVQGSIPNWSTIVREMKDLGFTLIPKNNDFLGTLDNGLNFIAMDINSMNSKLYKGDLIVFDGRYKLLPNTELSTHSKVITDHIRYFNNHTNTI